MAPAPASPSRGGPRRRRDRGLRPTCAWPTRHTSARWAFPSCAVATSRSRKTLRPATSSSSASRWRRNTSPAKPPPAATRFVVWWTDKPSPPEIVRVVGDARYDSLTDEAQPTVYFPHPELAYELMTLVRRTSGAPAARVPAA